MSRKLGARSPLLKRSLSSTFGTPSPCAAQRLPLDGRGRPDGVPLCAARGRRRHADSNGAVGPGLGPPPLCDAAGRSCCPAVLAGCPALLSEIARLIGLLPLCPACSCRRSACARGPRERSGSPCQTFQISCTRRRLPRCWAATAGGCGGGWYEQGAEAGRCQFCTGLWACSCAAHASPPRDCDALKAWLPWPPPSCAAGVAVGLPLAAAHQ